MTNTGSPPSEMTRSSDAANASLEQGCPSTHSAYTYARRGSSAVICSPSLRRAFSISAGELPASSSFTPTQRKSQKADSRFSYSRCASRR